MEKLEETQNLITKIPEYTTALQKELEGNLSEELQDELYKIYINFMMKVFTYSHRLTRYSLCILLTCEFCSLSCSQKLLSIETKRS